MLKLFCLMVLELLELLELELLLEMLMKTRSSTTYASRRNFSFEFATAYEYG